MYYEINVSDKKTHWRLFTTSPRSIMTESTLLNVLDRLSPLQETCDFQVTKITESHIILSSEDLIAMRL